MSDGEGGKKSGYRLEYASSARAKCKGPKPCAGTAIGKGELRVGSLVDFKGNTSFSWRHWGCTTNKIIENMKKNFEDASELDGYEDLRPEDQEKVNKAWEDGQVADEDIPESARKAPNNNSGGETDKDEAKEKAKKKKAAAAKKRKVEKDAAPDLEDDEDEKPKKKRAPSKKKAPAEKKEKAPAKKRSPKKKKAAETDEESGEDFTAAINDVEGDEEDAEETPDEDAGAKKRKRPASKSKGAKSPAKKAKSSGSRAKKSKAMVEDEDDED